MYNEFEHKLRQNIKCEFIKEAVLADHCWYRIGGPADFLVFPGDIVQLRKILITCRELNVPYYVIGSGANLLIHDSGFRGVIIKLKGSFEEIALEANIVSAGAGTELKEIIRFCEKRELAGMAELAGIPGTLGGALTMNAGTDKGVIGDIVKEVSIITSDGKIVNYESNQIDFGYRSVPQLQGKLICFCQLALTSGNKQEIREIRLKQLQIRKEKQPLSYPSCGSVFKRPPGNFAGKLIEEAGLKGLRYGDAQISEKHAGFIVNLGSAKAVEVKYLMDKVQEVVFSRFGIQLEPEVQLLGFQEN
jgi:UDP-N-acetylmuramate dehydrogenase